MIYSDFGQALTRPSAIVELMEDLGEALNNNPDLLFLGGGNPAQLPEVTAIFQRHLAAAVSDAEACSRMLGVYQSPQGHEALLSYLEQYFVEQCGWPVERRNIAVLSGSQSAFFLLLNLFAGPNKKQQGAQQIALPLVPEYLGYRSQGLGDEHFKAFKPGIELIDHHRFKYRVNFNALDFASGVGAVCVSRPTNPSGNLLSDDEHTALRRLCEEQGIPLITDLAYGEPFPGIVYKPVNCPWQPGMINVMSLSKLGLPGARTAIVVADAQVIDTLVKMNTTMNLANGNVGPELFSRLLHSGDLQHLTRGVLLPYYSRQRDILISLLDQYLQGYEYRTHLSEGAFFVWLWLPQLGINSMQLYHLLKEDGVLVMAGEPFFYGLEADWPHASQCVRLTFCQPAEVLERAVQQLAKVVAKHC